MDMQSGGSQSDSGKLEQIVSQFRLKSLHIILDSRIPSLRPHDHSGDLSSASRVRRSDKWFNLVLGDRPAALDNLNYWHRNLMDPMIIDIILVQEGSSSSVDNLHAASSVGTPVETVIERWVIQYDTPRFTAPQVAESSSYYKKTYKKSIILLRALYSQMRLLPAYRVYRQLSSSSHTYNFDIIYKVSSFSDPFLKEEELMKEHIFAPVEANPGRLCISVTYRTTLSDFNLEPVASLPAKIITDYVGSPTTDPLRSFPSIDKGVSFPLRGVRPPASAPFQRPHSWTSGFHRPSAYAQNQPFSGSPPTHRTSNLAYDFPSPPTDFYGNRVHNYRPPASQKSINYDEYQLSPPFSPSASPSAPTYLSGGNPVQTRMHSETAPVTIPRPMTSRSLRHFSPNFSDSSRSSLPPLSPRSSKPDTSSQESPSGVRSLRKSESMRAAEAHLNHYSSQKVSKDSRDDSGRFSALLSSSSSPRVGFSRTPSRLSFQDDLDDCDFSCPFDVDDVDTSDHTSQSYDGKKALDVSSQSLPTGRQSQDAAVGVLVHMLRTAPPLRQDSSCFSSQSLKTEVDAASGFFVPRRAADALEELRSYREMKDLLLSKSGSRSQVLRKQEKETSALLGSSSS